MWRKLTLKIPLPQKAACPLLEAVRLLLSVPDGPVRANCAGCLSLFECIVSVWHKGSLLRSCHSKQPLLNFWKPVPKFDVDPKQRGLTLWLDVSLQCFTSMQNCRCLTFFYHTWAVGTSSAPCTCPLGPKVCLAASLPPAQSNSLEFGFCILKLGCQSREEGKKVFTVEKHRQFCLEQTWVVWKRLPENGGREQ